MLEHFLVSAMRILTAVLTGVIAVAAGRAFLATRRRSIFALAAGAALLSVGYLVEGLLVELAQWDLLRATAIESASTLVAMVMLVASLYLRDARRASAVAELAEGPAPFDEAGREGGP